LPHFADSSGTLVGVRESAISGRLLTAGYVPSMEGDILKKFELDRAVRVKYAV